MFAVPGHTTTPVMSFQSENYRYIRYRTILKGFSHSSPRREGCPIKRKDYLCQTYSKDAKIVVFFLSPQTIWTKENAYAIHHKVLTARVVFTSFFLHYGKIYNYLYTRRLARLGNLASGGGGFSLLLKCKLIFIIHHST